MKVTDPSDSAVAENTFAINWHKPYENGVKKPLLPENQGISYDQNASHWTSVNDPITVTVKPAAFSLIYGVGGSALTGVLAGGTALVWTTGSVAPVVSVLLLICSYGLASSAPQDKSFTEKYTYAMYANAIERQYNINQGAPGTENDVQYVFPVSLANTAYPGLTSQSNAANDPTWEGGGLSGKVAVARPWTKQPWEGDAYDSHGYSGPGSWDVYTEQTHFYVNQITNNVGAY